MPARLSAVDAAGAALVRCDEHRTHSATARTTERRWRLVRRGDERTAGDDDDDNDNDDDDDNGGDVNADDDAVQLDEDELLLLVVVVICFLADVLVEMCWHGAGDEVDTNREGFVRVTVLMEETQERMGRVVRKGEKCQ